MRFTGSEGLDEACVPFFGAFGAAWDDAMVARRSGNPFGMLWPEMDAAFVTSDGNGGGPPAAERRPVVMVATVDIHPYYAHAPASCRKIGLERAT